MDGPLTKATYIKNMVKPIWIKKKNACVAAHFAAAAIGNVLKILCDYLENMSAHKFRHVRQKTCRNSHSEKI